MEEMDDYFLSFNAFMWRTSVAARKMFFASFQSTNLKFCKVLLEIQDALLTLGQFFQDYL
jgi:hypothetical protein